MPPRGVVVARELDAVVPALEAVQEAVSAGSWAVGFVAYEAAPALDSALVTRAPEPGLPLVWFALVDPPREVAPVGASGAGPDGGDGDGDDDERAWSAGAWAPDTSPAEHAQAVARVRERIARGETYQVNLTLRLRAPFSGDAAALYADLVRAQRGDHGALLDLRPWGEDVVVASASPEAFFAVVDDPGAPGRRRVVTRPMKGTAPRGRSAAEDALALGRLASSAKERAENVMIVDLLRNDLHRVCEPGSVEVSELLAAQTYPTVHQVVSTVEGRLREGTSTVDLFRALFPCGSVTGAPKASTMRAIAALERSPRGVYCGAVGWLAPPGEPVTARFSVAIRTAVVTGGSREGGGAEVVYGTGSGVTWGSRAGAEHREVLAKAAVLGHREPRPGLLETLAHRPGVGLVDVERHLRRLRDSAAFVGVPLDEPAARAALDAAVAAAKAAARSPAGAEVPLRVRLELSPDGRASVTTAPLPSSSSPVRLVVDDAPRVRSDDWWPRHKTTRRAWIEQLRAEHRVGGPGGPDEVVWTNERGEVCEASTATLAVRLDGRWWTPPVECGLLPGVLRERLLESGQLELRVLHPGDLRRAEGLAVLSSLRGWRAAVLA
ncbi:bifunctional anthranilate synthase component I family protein/class IV aminotransferase [Quadrisphaera sp. RL12-1S]|nr:bifunctional anthranilate synthase component I family protein/class IV aminotransferase [Quadrisphaera sp. RL12-1S]MBC3764076.1 bifunctional anthranilate synthase component I family protein/class IV aminotransferase [Quadrisphaera sp. RL12-1S]